MKNILALLLGVAVLSGCDPDLPDDTVVKVVDGDTVDLADGERVRLAGIDTPERGQCGFDVASQRMEELVLGKAVNVVITDDPDRYGRLIAYVEVDGFDVGEQMLLDGLAIARYDSRDGYGEHPREQIYIAADEATPNPCGG